MDLLGDFTGDGFSDLLVDGECASSSGSGSGAWVFAGPVECPISTSDALLTMNGHAIRR